MATIDDIKKVSPEGRIKLLEELEEERKKEIEQAEELIKETARELADAEEKKRIPIPEARATELSTLNTLEEKQLVATHHLVTAEALPQPQQQPQTQQQKTLEDVATEEAPRQQAQQQMQGFRKPEYAIGTEQQRSAFGEYLSKSQQAVTGAAPPGSSELEKITEIYKDRAVTGAEAGDAQQKYFGTHQQVTGGYELRKSEEDDRKERTEYRRRGGPA